MVAVTLWIALAAELAIYAALTRWLGLGSTATVFVCLVLVIGARVGFILLTFLLTRVTISARQLMVECGAFLAAWALMLVEPLLRPDGRVARPGAATLLVHGWNCNSAIWWPLLRRLRAHRSAARVFTVNLSPWADLEEHAQRLRCVIDDIAHATDAGRIAVVGHSMGGVAALAAMAEPEIAEKVGRLIALGAPFGGTTLARYAFDPAGRALRSGRTQALASHVQVTTIYSDTDNFIAPAASAHIKGAENVLFAGRGHLELLFARPVLDAVVDRLEGGDEKR